MLNWRLLLLVLSACGGARSAAAVALANLPEQVAIAPIAQHVRVNGLPMEIQAVAAPWNPSAACARIVERWSRAGRTSLLRCRPSDGWLLASACVGTREWTVQLRAAPAGSRGYLSSVDLSARLVPPPPPRVPLLPGAQVRGVLESSGGEGGTHQYEVRQYTIGLPGAPAIALRRLAERASRLGWQLTQPPSSRGGPIEWHRAAAIVRGFLAADGERSGLVLVEGGASESGP